MICSLSSYLAVQLPQTASHAEMKRAQVWGTAVLSTTRHVCYPGPKELNISSLPIYVPLYNSLAKVTVYVNHIWGLFKSVLGTKNKVAQRQFCTTSRVLLWLLCTSVQPSQCKENLDMSTQFGLDLLLQYTCTLALDIWMLLMQHKMLMRPQALQKLSNTTGCGIASPGTRAHISD